MAGVTNALCTSFKAELLTGTHNFTATTGSVFKIALFRATASLVGTYGAATTNYSDMTGNSDEHSTSGTGYSAGGFTLTNVTPTTSSTTAYLDFSPDASWAASTITSPGALIYNSSASNKAVAVLSFGSDKISSSGTFTIVFPTADASSAIIRIA